MSNLDTMLENASAYQDLFVDLNEKAAETISGGAWDPIKNTPFDPGTWSSARDSVIKAFSPKNEKFHIYNQTGYRITYNVDGRNTRYTNASWSTNRGGNISFDSDFGRRGVQLKKYNLRNGGKYAFRLNTNTAYPYDFDLVRLN